MPRQRQVASHHPAAAAATPNSRLARFHSAARHAPLGKLQGLEHERREGRAPSHQDCRARSAGLAGATVLRGVEGFGASSIIHTSRLLTMSEDLPMVIVDTPDRIDRFLPQLDELIDEGLVVREAVDIIKYEGRRSDS